MKKQIDGPIAQLIRDLADRGMLKRTLVVVATEFGRTIANQPKAGIEPVGFAESQSGEDLHHRRRKDVRLSRPFFQRQLRCCSSAAVSSRVWFTAARPTAIR